MSQILGPSGIKLFASRTCQGAARSNRLCSCHSLFPRVLPACTLKKVNVSKTVGSSKCYSKKASSRGREAPVVHLLRRVPQQVWHRATGRMRIPGAMEAHVASSLLGVNIWARGSWDKCGAKGDELEGKCKIHSKLGCMWNTPETFICVVTIQ